MAEDEIIEIDPEKTVVTFGTAVKMLEGNKIGGYLVRYSSPKDPDLSGEFFTSKTQFGPAEVLPVFYQHGYDGALGKRIISKGDVKFDDLGIWLEAQLEMRDEYEKMIADLVKQGKLGWSSGSLGHLVEYEPVGKATWIKTWILGEASLTPTPAEPRNSVIPLKTLLGDNTAIQKPEGEAEAVQAQSEGGKENAETNQSILQGAKKMDLTPELLQQTVADASAKAAEEAVKKFRESEPPIKTVEANITVVTDEADRPWRNHGEFFQAVKSYAYRPQAMDPRLKAATGLNETEPALGGFLVPPEVDQTIHDIMWQQGTLLSVLNVQSINSNRMIYNMVDETSRADGSRWGGVRGYWLAEAASKTASYPKFKQVDIPLNKVAVLCYATDELLSDSAALVSWLSTTVPQELRFKVENAVINGLGAGEPLGILTNALALTSATRTDASEIDAFDIGRMWASRIPAFNDYVWAVNPTVYPQLLNLVIGTSPVFLPSGQMSGNIGATLLGRPMIELEYLPTLGTVGDILLFSPSAYLACQKGGVEQAVSIHVAFTTDQSVYRFVYRFGGAPIFSTTMTGYDTTDYGAYVVLTATT